MPTATVENYLKQILLAQPVSRRTLVPLGQLAKAMNVVPGTATTMVKTLAAAGLAEYELRRGVRLTAKGERLALNVLRRHRLVELFLVEVLGLDWSEVHPEAEVLEHAVSEKVLDHIDKLLNYPQFDPHGDPIPAVDGSIRDRRPSSLAECPAGATVSVVRIVDQAAPFLNFLETHGLTPGVTAVVNKCDPLADAMSVSPLNRPAVRLGMSAAAKILVTATTKTQQTTSKGRATSSLSLRERAGVRGRGSRT
jgi:DtxR family Mn-dependent transcriptional regulator